MVTSQAMSVAKSIDNRVPVNAPLANNPQVNAPLANNPQVNMLSVKPTAKQTVPPVSNKAPSDLPIPSPYPTPKSLINKPVRVKYVVRENKTETPVEPVIKSVPEPRNYFEIFIIVLLVYMIYRCVRKPYVKKKYIGQLPIHTPPTSPDNKQEVYYGFQDTPDVIYRRSNKNLNLKTYY
jgi:hypothetical protein